MKNPQREFWHGVFLSQLCVALIALKTLKTLSSELSMSLTLAEQERLFSFTSLGKKSSMSKLL